MPAPAQKYTYVNNQDRLRRKPFRWWYEAIIDYRLANPGSTNKEAAAHFGVTEAYYSVIVNSDMFKARWNQRRAAYSEALQSGLEAKMLKMADRSLDLLSEQIEKKRDTIPFQQLADFTDKTLARLGYGIKPAAPVNVQVNTGGSIGVQVSAEGLAEARAALRRTEELRRLESGPVPRTEFHSLPVLGEVVDVQPEVGDAPEPTPPGE